MGRVGEDVCEKVQALLWQQRSTRPGGLRRPALLRGHHRVHLGRGGVRPSHERNGRMDERNRVAIQ